MSNETTRRAWLAGAAAGVLAAQQPPVAVKLPHQVRIGIIGLDGHFAEIVKPLPNLEGAELVAVCDHDAAELAKFKTARHYTDYRAMLDKEQLDVVGICNNNGDRAAAILACLERELHVAAEKPLAIHMADFHRVKQAIAKSGAKVTMLLPMRFDPMYLAMKRSVEAGEIGEVLQITSQKSYKAGRRPDWYLRFETYGGTIPWIGIHMVDLMRWTSGRDFSEVMSLQKCFPMPGIGEMENVTGSLFRMDNGGVALLNMDYLRPLTAKGHGDDRLRLAGRDGVVEYQEATGVTLMSKSGASRVITDLPPARSLFTEFLQSIYLGGAPPVSMDDIYRLNDIVLRARDSAEKHQIISL